METSLTINLKSHSVVQELNLKEILSYIKNGINEEHINKQIELRLTIDKKKKEKLKEQFVCYTPHASFNYVNISQLQALSGIIYIDLDNVKDVFETRHQLAKNELVHACYTSISGTGLGIWVKVDTSNLTPDDYRGKDSVIDQVANHLGVNLDRNARGVARMNIIPYDPLIYVNENSKTFIPANQKTTTRKELKEFLFCDSNERYRVQTQLPDYNNQEYVVIDEGKGYMDTYIVNRVIPEGRRNSTLRAIAVANIYNNQNKPEKAHLGRLININNEYCKSPLAYDEVLSIHNSIWKQYTEGTLNFKVKNKYIWFNPKTTLTKKEKCGIAGKEGGKIRSNRTKNEIREAIEKMYLEEIIITQKNIAEATGKNLKTIKRHWPEFKKDVQEINKLIKNGDEKTEITPTIQMEKTEMGEDNICKRAASTHLVTTSGNGQELQTEQKGEKGLGNGFFNDRNNCQMGRAGGEDESQQLDFAKLENIMENNKLTTAPAKITVPAFMQDEYLDIVKALKPNDLVELTQHGEIMLNY